MSDLRSITFGFVAAVCAASAYLLYPAPADSANARVVAAADDGGFDLIPPTVADLYITARTQDSQGNNALLAVTYAANQALPASLPLQVGGRQATLVRDSQNPQRYTAVIAFDFDAFLAEQTRRQQLAPSKPWVPRFDGREHIGDAPWAFLDPAQLRSDIARQVAIRIPRDVLLGPPIAISAPRSLMVVHPLVVEDPTRTYDACTNTGNPNGAWTFNKLMTDMANQPVTGVDPSDFVAQWLLAHAGASTVNGYTVDGSPAFSQILSEWPRLSGGKLNLAKSPMRLLAIVNRVDLRTNSAYGGGSAGEGRFVFGVIRPMTGGGCQEVPLTVILEYGVPKLGCPAVRSYAQQWAGLSTLVLGSSGYNAALQALTDQFALANASPGKPNRSAINQVRTNEEPWHPFWDWRQREDQLTTAGPWLRPATTKQTPDRSFNTTASASPRLPQYVNANAPAILAGTYRVPQIYAGTRFLGGDTVTEPYWQHNLIANNNARHKFSLNTCGACHGPETDTDFTHIAPRASGAQAALSSFLTGAPAGGTLDAPMTYTLPDPAVPTTLRSYGDLAFRQSHLSTLASSSCPSGGLFTELHFFPIAMSATH